MELGKPIRVVTVEPIADPEQEPASTLPKSSVPEVCDRLRDRFGLFIGDRVPSILDVEVLRVRNLSGQRLASLREIVGRGRGMRCPPSGARAGSMRHASLQAPGRTSAAATTCTRSRA